MRRIFFAFLYLSFGILPRLSFAQQNNGHSPIDLSDNKAILTAIIENKIQVYDKHLNKISKEIIVKKFSTSDTTYLNSPNPDFLEDNIYHRSNGVDIIHYRDLNLDTITFKNDYLLFFRQMSTSTGEYLFTDTPFIIHKTKTKVPYKNLFEFAQLDLDNRSIARTITTKQKEYWSFKEIAVFNEKLPLGNCLQSYHLMLDSNFRFHQLYTDNAACKALKSDNNNGRMESIKFSVPHRDGFWNIFKNELILYNEYGKDLYHFLIQEYSDHFIKLKLVKFQDILDYEIELKKVRL